MQDREKNELRGLPYEEPLSAVEVRGQELEQLLRTEIRLTQKRCGQWPHALYLGRCDYREVQVYLRRGLLHVQEDAAYGPRVKLLGLTVFVVDVERHLVFV